MIGFFTKAANYGIADFISHSHEVLRNHDTAREIAQRMLDFQLPEADDVVPERDNSSAFRTYGVGAQILSDLGVNKMRVLSAPKSIDGLSRFDLEVVEYVDCE